LHSPRQSFVSIAVLSLARLVIHSVIQTLRGVNEASVLSRCGLEVGAREKRSGLVGSHQTIERQLAHAECNTVSAAYHCEYSYQIGAEERVGRVTPYVRHRTDRK
jgi:hypothetical protein